MAEVVDVNPEIAYVDNAKNTLSSSKDREASEDERTVPEEEQQGPFGWIVYNFASDLIAKAQTKTIAVADLLLLVKEDRAEDVAKIFSEAYDKKTAEVKERDGVTSASYV